MEGGDGVNNCTVGSSRWNPTKEQIMILENLYEQGIRTPNAHQIQHIATTLSAYSHIQAKNVFYWFQNHKARLRQKQRLKQQQQQQHQQHQHQTTIPYFNRFLHISHPIFSSPNVIWAPYSQTHSEIWLYPQQHQMAQEIMRDNNEGTLPLFPLHPTGILEAKERDPHIDDDDDDDDDDGDDHGDDAFPGNQPLFDFLCLGQASPTE